LSHNGQLGRPEGQEPVTAKKASTAERGAPDDERVPFFGTWRTIYAAVIVCAAAVMVLLALFSRWPF
jgi:hypothetical protein